MREDHDRNRRINPKAFRIAGVYALIGVLWILFSDMVLLQLVGGDARTLAKLQVFKGWLFIAFTAVLLYWLVCDAFVEGERIERQLEARVVERTAQLETANRELEGFSYSVSHDLKAPLRGIDGYSQILLEDYADRLDTDGQRFLRNIRGGVAQMHQLIEDMLAYSRMERRELVADQLELRALVDVVGAPILEAFRGAGGQVDIDVPAALRLNADREGLAVILRNLLENAVKFSREVESPRVRIDARSQDACVLIRVEDNGIGFSMKYHDKIFDIFQRLHRAEDYPGTGVGLALVKKAVTRMGGRTWAQGEPGKGAIFYVELPQ